MEYSISQSITERYCANMQVVVESSLHGVSPQPCRDPGSPPLCGVVLFQVISDCHASVDSVHLRYGMAATKRVPFVLFGVNPPDLHNTATGSHHVCMSFAYYAS